MADARYEEAQRALDGVSKSMKRLDVATQYLKFMMTLGDAVADVRFLTAHRHLETDILC